MRAFRAVLSELKMYTDEWLEVVNMVQSVLNNSLSTSLNKRTPMQVFTGHAETTPFALMLKDNVPVSAPLDFIKAQKLMEVVKLSNAMTDIYAQVAEKATRDRKAAIQKHNNKTHVRSPNFQVGDYVLVAEHRKSGVFKLQVKGKGPRRVARVESNYVFTVENLLKKELKAPHTTRLRLYMDKELNVTAELAQAAEHNDHQLYVVSKILDASYNEHEIFHDLLVAWRGFPGWRGHLRTLLSYGRGCSGRGGEVHRVARGHRRGARDAISLRVLMGKCYAMIRMRPLLISCAECSVVFSCGKVDYDKSG
jgi:hypothetical protein